MKNSFIAAVVCFMISTSAFANPFLSSSAAESTFKLEFKNATNEKWTYTKDYSKVSFEEDNKQMEAYFDEKGELIATSVKISVDELPINAKRMLAKKYGHCTVKEAIYYEGPEEVAYYIEVCDGKKNTILRVSDINQVSIYQKRNM